MRLENSWYLITCFSLFCCEALQLKQPKLPYNTLSYALKIRKQTKRCYGEFMLGSKKTQKIWIHEHCFDVEIAQTLMKRAIGLMFRNRLDLNKGMLFIFRKERVYPFWMMSTRIPLDIIWINKEFRVVFIKKRALPCKGLFCPSINPKKRAKYVLEINGGLSDVVGLRVDDKIHLQQENS